MIFFYDYFTSIFCLYFPHIIHFAAALCRLLKIKVINILIWKFESRSCLCIYQTEEAQKKEEKKTDKLSKLLIVFGESHQRASSGILKLVAERKADVKNFFFSSTWAELGSLKAANEAKRSNKSENSNCRQAKRQVDADKFMGEQEAKDVGFRSARGTADSRQ